ncbi:PepSY domain-containing protein [Verrucomicrobium sp. 3C]|uniref:PepSY domain-containing protein n=1 Tax=Verrucomicrobium sp. 3C TaxID=1134055 RepID=UPI00035F3E58|nr:PepSY domain-containing protein [Verrucomicrobium sp. 3C]
MKGRKREGIAAMIGVLLAGAAPLRAAECDFEGCLRTALAEKPGKVWEMEIEREEQGGKIYKFEIKDREGKEWKVLVNAQTGCLVETEEVVGRGNAAFENGAKISPEEARQTALEKVPGKVKEVERKLEKGGMPVYEVEIVPRSGGGEREVEVGALSGEVREIREERYEIGEQEGD